MSTRTPSPFRIIASLATIAAIFVAIGDSRLTASINEAEAQPQSPPLVQEHQTSLSPRVSAHNATPAQLHRLALAFERFANAGLQLPALEIHFPTEVEVCDGAHGRFRTSTTPWLILICPTDLDTVYEHELAHAWERANLTDQQRQTFMEMRGYEVWNDKSVPWNERGMEGVAFIIQQGLSGLPLPPVLSAEQRSRLTAFEYLTGDPDPRLEQWKG